MSSNIQPIQNVSSSNATTVATLVSSLTSLVGGSGGVTSNANGNQQQGIVTAFIASHPNMSGVSTTISSIPKPLIVGNTQPLILPKPNLQKSIIHTTPPKANYISNPSILNSPVPPSPSQSWTTTSPFNRKRAINDFDTEATDSKKQRRTPSRCTNEKGGKGLRHFSMKVCEKVQLKGVTTYNEVADELVQEFTEQNMNSTGATEQSYDQKNIRRRVYDALNVLKAMNIITNEKKEIRWVGLPTNSAQECKHLEDQKLERSERIKQKMQQLKELLVQQIAFKNLVERNKQAEKKQGAPPSNACIHLPFIIVNTSKKTVIDCSISSDKSEYLFNFDEAFEIHDDIEVLKRMGLSFGLDKGECSEKNLSTARKMVPRSLEPYVQQMANGTYGDIELVNIERTASFSPLAIPLSTDHARSGTSKSKRASTKTQHIKISNNVLRTSSSLSAASDYDSENEGDDERTMLVES